MKEHDRLFTELKEDSRIQKMSQYIQHGKVSTYDHCCRVADLSSRINRRLRLHADEETLLKGAMLHDYYLYDWHEKDGGTHRLHGFRHPEKAARNADRDFGIATCPAAARPGSSVWQISTCRFWRPCLKGEM